MSSLLDSYESPKPQGGLLDSYKSPAEAAPSEGGWLSTANHALSVLPAVQAGLIKGATLGNFDPSKIEGPGGALYRQGAEDHPTLKRAAEFGGNIATGAVAGAGVGAAAEGLGLASKAASTLGEVGKAAGRIGLNAAEGGAQGFLTKPEEGDTRAGNAMTGALFSGALSTGGEALGAVTKPAARIKENLTAQKDREGFATYARDKIAGTRQGLLDSEKKNATALEDLLRGKQVPVSGTTMEGNELNTLKKSYDAQSRRPPGAMWSTGEAAKAAEAGQQADMARAAIEAAEPGAKALNADMQRELKLRSWLKKSGDRAPIQTLTTPSADKQALLAEAGRRGGTDIAKFGSDTRLAKSLTFRPSDLSHMGMGTAIKAAGRLGLEAGAGGEAVASRMRDPATLAALLAAIQTPSK